MACQGRTPNEALGVLSGLAGREHVLARPLALAGTGARKMVLRLVDATRAGAAQAIAHALGCHWAEVEPVPGAPRRVVFSAAGTLPIGTVDHRARPSGLAGKAWSETLALRALAPWLADDRCGLMFDPVSGVWGATLDAAGHARLLDVLAALERAQPACPALLPDPDDREPAQRTLAPLRASDWAGLVDALGDAGVSAALAAGVTGATARAVDVPVCSVGELPARLAAAGITARFVRGVLCLGMRESRDLQHPAQRQLVAVVPIGHLLRGGVDGALVADAIERRIAPIAFGEPGALCAWLQDRGSLLLIADPGTVHRALDALARIDHLGAEAGLAALAGRE